MDLLIIPDPHAHPDFDNVRFDVLSTYIVETRPDVIVCLGDLADMYSLSSYDRGTKRFEGRRYNLDVAAAVDAQHRLFSKIVDYNDRASAGHRQRYRPTTHFFVGNHEDRIDRAIDLSPELDGTISISDVVLPDYWQHVHSYKSIVNVHGFAISHFLPGGVQGNAIGGKNIAARLLAECLCSAIVGHNHTLDISIKTSAIGKRTLGLSAGCFAHPDMVEGWNRNTSHMYWRGVVHLRDVHDGWAEEIETVSMRRMFEIYS